MTKKVITALLGLVAAWLCATTASAQKAALKTNLIHAGATFTPNLGLEFKTGTNSTLDIAVGYNPWNRKGSVEDNRKWVHLSVQPEYRYWPCEAFNGSFWGAHALFTHHNVGEVDAWQFNKGKLFDKQYRYEGFAYGLGVSYGYHWVMGKRVAMEFQLGLGAAYLDQDRYDCAMCGRDKTADNRWYFGPTKANIGFLIYLW